MAKLVFEEIGGDQFWIEIKGGELSLQKYSFDSETGETLLCGEDVHAFLQFMTEEARKAQFQLDREANEG